MDYTIIIRPLIGATIGLVTNYIAVKMLFRPLKEVKIGKIKMPFTPGVIPKNKERIAKSIGETISNHLLTEEELEKALLSEEKKKRVYEKAKELIEQKKDDSTIKEEALKMISEESLQKVESNLNIAFTKTIVKELIEQDMGRMIAAQIEKVAIEKASGSMLGALGLNALISNLSGEVAIKINEYIEKNGEDIVSSMLTKKMAEWEETKVSDVIELANNHHVDIAQVTVVIYQKVISEKLSSILKEIGISQIVTDKINQMDNLELEGLILKIMKKELNALIGLGALIGLILGLLNLLF